MSQVAELAFLPRHQRWLRRSRHDGRVDTNTSNRVAPCHGNCGHAYQPQRQPRTRRARTGGRIDLGSRVNRVRCVLLRAQVTSDVGKRLDRCSRYRDVVGPVRTLSEGISPRCLSKPTITSHHRQLVQIVYWPGCVVRFPLRRNAARSRLNTDIHTVGVWLSDTSAVIPATTGPAAPAKANTDCCSPISRPKSSVSKVFWAWIACRCGCPRLPPLTHRRQRRATCSRQG